MTCYIATSEYVLNLQLQIYSVFDTSNYIFPFSERKGYIAFKYHEKCLKFVCLSKPIRLQQSFISPDLIYFTWTRTQPKVFEIKESESEIIFSEITFCSWFFYS